MAAWPPTGRLRLSADRKRSSLRQCSGQSLDSPGLHRLRSRAAAKSERVHLASHGRQSHKAMLGKLILLGCVILAVLLLWFFVSPILAVLVLGLSALAVGTFIATGISTDWLSGQARDFFDRR